MFLILTNNDEGHAVLAIGHENNDLTNIKNIYPGLLKNSWVDVSSFKKKLILIDDNLPPYQVNY